MKKSLMVMALMGASSAFSADVMYSEKPETEPIAVTAGTSTFMGSALVDDLIAYWSFDNPNDLGKDDSGNGNDLIWAKGGNDSIAYGRSESDAAYVTNECKRGSAISFAEGYSGAVTNVPPALDGTKPFTMCCWFYVNPDAVENGNAVAYGFMGLGNATNSNGSASAMIRIAASNASRETTLSTISFGPATSGSGSIGTSQMDEPKPTTIKEAGWVHVAMTYTPDVDAGTASYACRLNGGSTLRYASGNAMVEIPADPSDYVLFVGSCRYTKYFRSIRFRNLLLDEAMIFSKALSRDEILWVMEHTRPADFAASWKLDETGILNLAGSTCLQDIFGAGGTVTSPTAMKIGSDESRCFGGGFAGAGDVELSPAEGETMLLSGSSAHGGKTVVKSGTVALVSSGANELKATFGDNLRAFWNFDGLGADGWSYDWSGNGDPLKEGRQTWATAQSYVANTVGSLAVVRSGIEHVLGTAIGMGTNKEDNRLQPYSAISGFNSEADNSFTFAIWAKTASDSTSRSGFFRFDNVTAGVRFNNGVAETDKTLLFGYKSDKYISVNMTNYLKPDEENLGGGEWHHFVVTYDKSLPRKADDSTVDTSLDANKHYRVYVDGQLASAQAGTNTAAKIKNFGYSGRLYLGTGLENANGRTWHGWLDECVVLNRVATAEEVQFLYGHRQATPTVATGILPADGELEVASGATAAFDLANETVAKLSGAGAVELSATAKLSVTDAVAFTGTFSGAGKLALGENLKWATPVDGKGRALAGKYTYFTVPTSMLYEYSSANWTTVAPTARGAVVKVFARDNGDGTVTFMATVENPGLTIIFR